MYSVRFSLTPQARQAVERHLKTAQQRGHLRQVKSLLAILAVGDGRSFAAVAVILRVHEKTVAAWIGRCCCAGLSGTPRHKPTARPPQLTPTQKAALATLIDEGPVQAGLSGAGWRSPMVQPLLYDRCGVFYNVFYMAQWLTHRGLSYQKAAFVSDPLDAGTRHAWCTTPWPQMLRLATEPKALLLVGDAAAFPQWGTRSYTWARRGPQPLVKTSGKRKGYHGFGLIDDCTGRFLDQGQEGRLNSEAYSAFLTRVLDQVTPPIMLLHDGARYHTSVAMQRFFAQHTERLTVFQWPSDAPDYHPIEKLWKNVTTAGTHFQYFPTFAALTENVEHALLPFANTPAEILALCRLPSELAQAA
jgi:transposase